MGWTSWRGFTRKEDYIPELVKDTTASKSVAYELVGDVLWEVRDFHSGAIAGKLICCTVFEAQCGELCYKEMDECMGPYYYSCPLAYLDMAPVTNQNWRDAVIRNHRDVGAYRKCLAHTHGKGRMVNL